MAPTQKRYMLIQQQDPEELQTQLNKAGSYGWRVVGVSGPGRRSRVILELETDAPAFHESHQKPNAPLPLKAQ